MSRSVKKGPYVEARLLKRVEELNAANDKKSSQNMVESEHDLPADGRTHDRGA